MNPPNLAPLSLAFAGISADRVV